MALVVLLLRLCEIVAETLIPKSCLLRHFRVSPKTILSLHCMARITPCAHLFYLLCRGATLYSQQTPVELVDGSESGVQMKSLFWRQTSPPLPSRNEIYHRASQTDHERRAYEEARDYDLLGTWNFDLELFIPHVPRREGVQGCMLSPCQGLLWRRAGKTYIKRSDPSDLGELQACIELDSRLDCQIVD